jgi:hypothetical protein
LLFVVFVVPSGVLYLGSACACSEYAHQHTARTEEQVKAASNARAAEHAETHGGAAAAATYNEMEDGYARRQAGGAASSPFGDSAGDGYGHGRGGGGGGGGGQAARGAYSNRHDDDDGGNPFANVGPRASAYG